MENLEEKKGFNKKAIMAFFVKTSNAMAYGLFATLVIGTILETLSKVFVADSFMFLLTVTIANFLKNMMGVAIGLGIAVALKMDGLKLISLAMIGGIAAYLNINIFSFDPLAFDKLEMKIGDPLVIYFSIIITYFIVNLILKKKTAADIILIPLLTVIIGTIVILIINQPLSYITKGISILIGISTEYQPFIMGIIISVLMGMALTAPISSAVIALLVFVIPTGASDSRSLAIAIAGGASVVGCSTQMIGFAVMSRKDNNIGVVLSIAFGTSMLQFKNIVKKPVIWLPTIRASAILGPRSACLLKMKCLRANAGMGTSGLVGQIGVLAEMGGSWQTWLMIICIHIIAPIVLVFLFDYLFRKFNIIKEGDLKI